MGGSSSVIISLFFLFLGGGFVLSLFKSIFLLISKDWSKENLDLKAVITVFKWPLIFMISLFLFVGYGIPLIEGK